MKKILLLSGYDAASHRYWRELLKNEINCYHWTQLHLPDRHFAWRSRGNSLTFASQYKTQIEQRYDLIIATSMVDLSALRGFIPKLCDVPTIVYFHENQFVYPVSKSQPNLVNAQLTSIYSAFCADKIVFNSQYNQNSFLQGAKAFLNKMPDGVPSDLVNKLTQKSQVLAVPIKSNNEVISNNQPKVPNILWNHRWEYDKQPEVFFDALVQLSQQGVDFNLNVLGQSFRNLPSCFEKSKVTLKRHIKQWGYLPQKDYQECLASSHIVVSTAIHEFQGLSMLNAMAAGATPIAPNRLVYPEYIPKKLLYMASESPKQETKNLVSCLLAVINNCDYHQVDVSKYQTESLLPRYIELFETLL